MVIQNLQEAGCTERFVLFIDGLRAAVCVEEETAPFFQKEPVLLPGVGESIQSGDGHAVRILKNREGAVRTPENGIFVSGVGGNEFSGGDGENAEPDGDEHFHGVVLTEPLIDEFQNFRGGPAGERAVLDECFRNDHEERRGNTFSGNICHDEGEMVVIDQVEVVEVAADLPGRLHAGEEIEFSAFREGRENRGEHGGLDAVRDVKLRGDAFPVCRDTDEILPGGFDALLHVQDGFRKSAHFIPDFQDGVEAAGFHGRLAGEAVCLPGDPVNRQDQGPAQHDRGADGGDQDDEDGDPGNFAEHGPRGIHELAHDFLHAENADGLSGAAADGERDRDVLARAGIRLPADDRGVFALFIGAAVGADVVGAGGLLPVPGLEDREAVLERRVDSVEDIGDFGIILIRNQDIEEGAVLGICEGLERVTGLLIFFLQGGVLSGVRLKIILQMIAVDEGDGGQPRLAGVFNKLIGHGTQVFAAADDGAEGAEGDQDNGEIDDDADGQAVTPGVQIPDRMRNATGAGSIFLLSGR